MSGFPLAAVAKDGCFSDGDWRVEGQGTSFGGPGAASLDEVGSVADGGVGVPQ